MLKRLFSSLLGIVILVGLLAAPTSGRAQSVLNPSTLVETQGANSQVLVEFILPASPDGAATVSAQFQHTLSQLLPLLDASKASGRLIDFQPNPALDSLVLDVADSSLLDEITQFSQVESILPITSQSTEENLLMQRSAAVQALQLAGRNDLAQTSLSSAVQSPSTTPYLRVDVFNQFIQGFLFNANTNVTINLKTSAAVLRKSWTTKTGNDGKFSITLFDQVTGNYLTPNAGDDIQVVPATGTPLDVTFPELTIVLNQSTSQVSGKALAGSNVEAQVCRATPTNDQSCKQLNSTASGGGSYTISFTANGGLIPGDKVTLYDTDSQGNIFITGRYLPNGIAVDVLNQAVFIYTDPSTSVILNVRDVHNTIVYTNSGSSNLRGELVLSSVGELNSGNVVEVNAAGSVTQMTLVPLSLTKVDRMANLIAGSGPISNNNLGLKVIDPASSTSYSSAIVNASGVFSLDLTGNWNLLGGQEVDLIYLNSAYNMQLFRTLVPKTLMDVNSQFLTGYSLAGSPVSVQLKNNGGNDVLNTCDTTAQFGGYWYCAFGGLMPVGGDIFSVTTFGATFDVPVPALTLSADTAADTVSGFAPPSSTLSVFVNGLFGNMTKTGNSLGDGSYSINFAPDFDIKHLTFAETDYYTPKQDDFWAYSILSGLTAQQGTYNPTWGYTTPNTSVGLTLSNSAEANAPTALKASAAPVSNSSGYFQQAALCNNSVPVAVLAGDTLAAASISSQVTLPAVTANINLSTSSISGTAPVNTRLDIKLFHQIASGGYVIFEIARFSTSTGAFTFDFSGVVSIKTGDYALVSLENTAGDRASYVFSTTGAAGLSANITHTPAYARSNFPMVVSWSVTGGKYSNSNIAWDTVSHACDRQYRNFAGYASGAPGSFNAAISAPAQGVIYLSVMADIDGNVVWSNEIAVPVSQFFFLPVITK